MSLESPGGGGVLARALARKIESGATTVVAERVMGRMDHVKDRARPLSLVDIAATRRLFRTECEGWKAKSTNAKVSSAATAMEIAVRFRTSGYQDDAIRAGRVAVEISGDLVEMDLKYRATHARYLNRLGIILAS